MYVSSARMASWVRSLFKKPSVAAISDPIRDDGDEQVLAAEHYGVFDDRGRCLGLPLAPTAHRRHCDVEPVDAVSKWPEVLRRHGVQSTCRPLRVVVISDTHEFHRHLVLPPGDVLIHCGDVLTLDRLNFGVISNYNIKDFFEWFNSQPFALRIVIGGNHDHQFQKLGKATIKALAYPSVYVEDELLDIGGLRILGTPRSTPNSKRSGNEAFQTLPWVNSLPNDIIVFDVRPSTLDAEADPAQHAVAVMRREDVPNADHVDFFLTHGSVNCSDVRRSVRSVAPALHFCGHVHEMHGAWAVADDEAFRLTPQVISLAQTVSINGASTRGHILKERLEPPIVLEYVVSNADRSKAVHAALQALPRRRT